jgi:hypothetical protein
MVWHLWFKSSKTTCLKFSNFVLFTGSIIYDILRVRQSWKKTSALRCLCLFPAVSNTHFRQPRRIVSYGHPLNMLSVYFCTHDLIGLNKYTIKAAFHCSLKLGVKVYAICEIFKTQDV